MRAVAVPARSSHDHCKVVQVRFLITMSVFLTSAASAQSLADRYFDEYYFPYNPTSATSAGIHQYDDQLEDYSAVGAKKRIAILKKFEAEFAKLPAGPD